MNVNLKVTTSILNKIHWAFLFHYFLSTLWMCLCWLFYSDYDDLYLKCILNTYCHYRFAFLQFKLLESGSHIYYLGALTIWDNMLVAYLLCIGLLIMAQHLAINGNSVILWCLLPVVHLLLVIIIHILMNFYLNITSMGVCIICFLALFLFHLVTFLTSVFHQYYRSRFVPALDTLPYLHFGNTV